jgi:hypothetical protein
MSNIYDTLKALNQKALKAEVYIDFFPERKFVRVYYGSEEIREKSLIGKKCPLSVLGACYCISEEGYTIPPNLDALIILHAFSGYLIDSGLTVIINNRKYERLHKMSDFDCLLYFQEKFGFSELTFSGANSHNPDFGIYTLKLGEQTLYHSLDIRTSIEVIEAQVLSTLRQKSKDQSALQALLADGWTLEQ